MVLQKIIIGVLLSLLLGHQAFAQACFNANTVRGCAPLTITLTDCSNGTNIAYKYSETEGFVDRNTNTYTTPGKYNITQIVQISGTGDSLRKQEYIEVLPTPLPEFELRMCANRKVSLNITDTQYEQCVVDWGDGSSVQVVSEGSPAIEHTYSSTGSFSLKVRGNYAPGGCGAEKAVLISPVSALPPPTMESIITNTRGATTGAITLKMLTRPDFDYEIYTSGNPTPLTSFVGISGTVTKTIDNLNTETGNICLKVKTLDKCGTSAESEAIYCYVSLKVTASDGRNILEWNPYLGNVPAGSFQQYVLYKNSQPFHIITNIGESTYIDENVTCKENYCYQVVAEFSSPTFHFTASTNAECVNAFSTQIPPTVGLLNATVETPRSIRLFWEVDNQPRIAQYEINRNGAIVVSASQSQDLLDSDLQIDKRFCYEVRYTNICDNSSAWAVKVCPVFLSALPIEAGKPRLQWTAYENPDNQLESYVLQKLNERLQVYEEIELASNVLAYTDVDAKTDRQIMRYRIKSIIDSGADVVSYSNVVEISQRFRLFFPNAFTPNSNGLNDTFKPAFLFVKRFKMTIYNRQGEIVFQTDNIEKGWDGTYKGVPVPADSYAYFAEAEDNTGEKFTTKNSFILIR
jgi:gliding motility-associated-like protein